MLFLLSPAKTLDYESPLPPVRPTEPLFTDASAQLIATLRKKSPRQVAGLMDISAPLGQAQRRALPGLVAQFTDANSRPAVLAFDGDVYDGLQARRLSPADLEWAQQHLCILSGLYGVLRPLDRMQPYRLEMGTALTVGKARNLYQFWGSRIADYLNERLAADASPVVVNLASQEYFRSVDLQRLKARVVECVFEDAKGDGPHKVISFFAKKARGLMARYAVLNRIRTPGQLEAFDLDGYRFDASASQPGRLVFRRTIST
jgi:cytoplasmic iron level regulating protein YaaA (DUF328/UPF0246 family)